MKSSKQILITGIFCITLASCVQKHTADNHIEYKLTDSDFLNLVNKQFESIRDYRGDWDSTELLHRRFADTLIKYRSLVFHLGQFTDSGMVKFARSPDSLLVIASWDDCSGGTMVMAKSISFYKTPSGIKVLPQLTYENNSKLVSGDFYTDIYSVKSGNGVIYLAQGFSRGSSILPGEGVRAFQIIHDSMINPEIFPESFRDKHDYNYQAETTGSTPKLSSSFGLGFDLHHCNDSFYAQRPITLFLQEGKILKVPKVNDLGGNTKEYYTLEFNGTAFVLRPLQAR